MQLTKEIYASSEVSIVTLESIPEDGQELFNIGSYPIIVRNGQVDIDEGCYTNWGSECFQKRERAAIGVQGGKTIMVQVEEPGITLKQLAVLMQSYQCTFASAVPFRIVDFYEEVEIEASEEQVAEEDMLMTGSEQLKQQPKKKKK